VNARFGYIGRCCGWQERCREYCCDACESDVVVALLVDAIGVRLLGEIGIDLGMCRRG
jgi:hypothetical protein